MSLPLDNWSMKNNISRLSDNTLSFKRIYEIIILKGKREQAKVLIYRRQQIINVEKMLTLEITTLQFHGNNRLRQGSPMDVKITGWEVVRKRDPHGLNSPLYPQYFLIKRDYFGWRDLAGPVFTKGQCGITSNGDPGRSLMCYNKSSLLSQSCYQRSWLRTHVRRQIQNVGHSEEILKLPVSEKMKTK